MNTPETNSANLGTHTEQAALTDKKPNKKPNTSRTFIELIVCIILPTLILKKLSGDEQLGSNLALVFALALPLGFGIYEFIESKKVRLIPALGFISILLTGGIGLLKLDSGYIAIKEALIPLVLAIATLVSTYTKYPLIRTFLYNDAIMDTDKVALALKDNEKENQFDQMMVKATWMLSASFFLSAILNYLLAKWIVVSPSGTPEFNDQLGTMNLMSYPVIVVPCMVITMFALYYVVKNIKKLTGLGLEDLMHQ